MLTSVLALGGLLPSAAVAALPQPKPPGKAVSEVRSWPVKDRETLRILHGYDVSVSINSPKRDVKLALIQVNGNGNAIKAVKRATVRKGKVEFALPTPGATYQLRADIGKKRFWSYIQVEPCGATPGDKGELRLRATSVRAGGFIDYDIANTSKVGCLEVGHAYSFERLQSDGSWALAGTSGPVTSIAYRVLPGKTHPKAVTVPADFAPGRYRVTDIVGGFANGVAGPMALHAEFDVIP